MSFQPPCFGDEEEDDHMDQDELYQRILLQHPDLLAPPSSTVPADSGIDIEYTYQPVDATETFHDQVILDKNRHELDPALADILRRHKELQMKRTTIMTHPTIQRQLKSFWYRLVEFNQRLLLQAEQKALQVLLGKSIDFDASAYLHQQSHQSSPTQLLPPRRPFSSSTAHFLCAGDAKFEGLRPIQSVAQIQINVKEKVRPATGGPTRRDSAPDIKKPMPALGRPLIHPKSAGKDKSRPPGIQHPLPHL
ncbi:hypothetical protein DYB37_005713 [Aphanomyces astaci]|uniref:Uncharacterized protein n=1 Tax=Aphanomyces astaci TaxID=112090 RepID=A0A418DM98_APHAT|nr:hypothetical protein DYB35_005767 [Aphanomyces astaci]RHZ33635.1 hypothetical protein DYB37_005713 [Aphanomyces astaci]